METGDVGSFPKLFFFVGSYESISVKKEWRCLWGVNLHTGFMAVDHHKFIKCILFVILSNISTKQREINETRYEREKRRDKNTRT